MSQRQPLQTNTPITQLLTKHTVALLAWASLLIVSKTAAQNVYRCGDQYSASPSCNGAIISSVEDARSDRQAQAQKAQTLQAQQEADALEKDRHKADQPIKHNAAPPHSVKRETLISGPVDHTAPVQTSRGQPRKSASPYFTAKDNTPKPPKLEVEKKGASSKAAP